MKARGAGHAARRLGTLAALGLMSACAASDSDEQPTIQELPVLAIPAEPSLEIGVVEGDAAYTFDQVTGVQRLSDGGVAVADGGSQEISLYAQDGTFAARWAGEGEGPGEFRALSRIYRAGTDSLIALDTRNQRISRFALDGAFDQQLDGSELSGDTIFTMDAWLHGRFWVEGGLMETDRQRLRSVLNALPAPRVAPGYRFARMSNDGGLWIREPGTVDNMRTWTITDPSGTPTALVQLPSAFEPLDLGTDEVLGYWTGESDVHFVRAFPLESTNRSAAVPLWLQGAESAVVEGPAPDQNEFTSLIRGELKHMASAQEIHYSQHYSYTTAIDSLEAFRPSDESIEIDFLFAGSRGWGAVFSHPAVDRICGLAYGFTIPAGWVPGMVMCAPMTPPAPADSGE